MKIDDLLATLQFQPGELCAILLIPYTLNKCITMRGMLSNSKFLKYPVFYDKTTLTWKKQLCIPHSVIRKKQLCIPHSVITKIKKNTES